MAEFWYADWPVSALLDPEQEWVKAIVEIDVTQDESGITYSRRHHKNHLIFSLMVVYG